MFITISYIFTLFPPSFHPFIFPLLTTLISLLIYPFIFLYFWLFLFSSSYYKFPILSHILCIVFSHTKCYFSLFLSKKIFSIFWWSWFPIMWLLWICCGHGPLPILCDHGSVHQKFFFYFFFSYLSLIFVCSTFASSHIIDFIFINFSLSLSLSHTHTQNFLFFLATLL